MIAPAGRRVVSSVAVGGPQPPSYPPQSAAAGSSTVSKRQRSDMREKLAELDEHLGQFVGMNYAAETNAITIEVTEDAYLYCEALTDVE
jgi:predicted SAM-dependent methyltransferase